MTSTIQKDPPETETSLSKAIRLLPLVAERNATGVNLSSVSRLAGLSTATTRRLLQGLVDGGLLSFDPYAKTYYLGAGVFDLARAPGSPHTYDSVRIALRGTLAEVTAATGEETYLSVRVGDDALCIENLPGRLPGFGNTLTPGSRRPLGAGAGSAALLAALPREERERIINRSAERYSRYGNLNTDLVRQVVKRWDTKHYTVNKALIIPGVAALSVAVFSGETLVAALSVAGKEDRMQPKRHAEMAEIMNHALNRVGYTTRPPAKIQTNNS